MDRLERYKAALAKHEAKLKADPQNERHKLNVSEYRAAVENIKKHGNPSGPKAPPHPGDVNINLS